MAQLQHADGPACRLLRIADVELNRWIECRFRFSLVNSLREAAKVTILIHLNNADQVLRRVSVQ